MIPPPSPNLVPAWMQGQASWRCPTQEQPSQATLPPRDSHRIKEAFEDEGGADTERKMRCHSPIFFAPNFRNFPIPDPNLTRKPTRIPPKMVELPHQVPDPTETCTRLKQFVLAGRLVREDGHFLYGREVSA